MTRIHRRGPFRLGLAALVLAAATLLEGCGLAPEAAPLTTSATSATPAGAGSDGATSAPASTTQSTDYGPMTTSEAWAHNSQEAQRVAQQLGDAVLSHLSGTTDLAALQSLVEPPAEDGLTQLLSVLSKPTKCEITRGGGSDSSTTVTATVRFTLADGETRTFDLTVVVGPDKTAITGIQPAAPDSTPPPTENPPPSYSVVQPPTADGSGTSTLITFEDSRSTDSLRLSDLWTVATSALGVNGDGARLDEFQFCWKEVDAFFHIELSATLPDGRRVTVEGSKKLQGVPDVSGETDAAAIIPTLAVRLAGGPPQTAAAGNAEGAAWPLQPILAALDSASIPGLVTEPTGEAVPAWWRLYAATTGGVATSASEVVGTGEQGILTITNGGEMTLIEGRAPDASVFPAYVFVLEANGDSEHGDATGPTRHYTVLVPVN